MKLIDGHAMIQRVEALHKRGTVDLSYYNIVKEAVQMEPSVDAVPVVHGRWTYFNCVGTGRYQCSECLHWVDAGTDRNYCPNCGAKMNDERRR